MRSLGSVMNAKVGRQSVVREELGLAVVEFDEEGDVEDGFPSESESQQFLRPTTKTPEQVKTETLDTRTEQMLHIALQNQTFTKTPEIHQYPAPPAIPPQGDPTLSHRKAPMKAGVGARKSYLESFMNSTLGRAALFLVTLLFVNVSIIGLVNWNRPEYRKEGTAFYHFWLGLGVFLTIYTLPLVAEKAGMKSLETGWKPYFVLYRLCFLTALPACILQVMGTGEQLNFGEPSGPAGTVQLKDLKNVYWNYFELKDGFVALNLTKGVTETLAAEEHGVPEKRRVSRFRDAELQVNMEPYSDEVVPTETPGRLATYRIAPVFGSWSDCTTRYRISTTCLARNPILAWAFAKSSSLCSSYKSVGCKPPKPHLAPIYKCSTDRVDGVGRILPIEGICGHVTSSPPAGALDELAALLLYDAWPKQVMPKTTTLFLDLSPDPCLDDITKCKANWSQMYLAGLVFQILTNLLIIVPAVLDCRMDLKIRQARDYQQKEAIKAKKALDAQMSKAT